MINPKSEDLGRAVTLVIESHPIEHGIITSVNKDFVFVKYNGELHSKATRRCDLCWRTKDGISDKRT